MVRAARARRADIPIVMDNAWGSPGLFSPFAHDVDISIVPLTKYWGGHGDLLLGAVVSNARLWPIVRAAAFWLGMCTSADEAYLALRGARTADVRLQAHGAAGLAVARWLGAHARVGLVLHPALDSCPGHEFWLRDVRGSNGLFAFELLDAAGAPARVAAGAIFADALVATGLFGLGYSWGGTESLVMPAMLPGVPGMVRTIRPWTGGALIRLHIGLQPVDQLIGALERALRV